MAAALRAARLRRPPRFTILEASRRAAASADGFLGAAPMGKSVPRFLVSHPGGAAPMTARAKTMGLNVPGSAAWAEYLRQCDGSPEAEVDLAAIWAAAGRPAG